MISQNEARAIRKFVFLGEVANCRHSWGKGRGVIDGSGRGDKCQFVTYEEILEVSHSIQNLYCRKSSRSHRKLIKKLKPFNFSCLAGCIKKHKVLQYH